MKIKTYSDIDVHERALGIGILSAKRLNEDNIGSVDLEKFARYINKTKFEIRSMPETEESLNSTIKSVRKLNKSYLTFFNEEAIRQCESLKIQLESLYFQLLEIYEG
jgi:hypothetical protein